MKESYHLSPAISHQLSHLFAILSLLSLLSLLSHLLSTLSPTYYPSFLR